MIATLFFGSVCMLIGVMLGNFWNEERGKRI